MSKFYITTPIYYVNDKPHIGHAYTTVMADILARYYRMHGTEVLFTTGTDENAKKNAEVAEEKGEDVQAYVNRMSANWQETFDSLNITHDRFIRTTEPDHLKAVETFWNAVNDRGDIYKGEYEGLYCTGCEAYKTETDLVDGLCPDHNRAPERFKEENYFFRLSDYRQRLLDHIEANPAFIQPKSRRNEIVSYIKDYMEDMSISRSGLTWGVPVPGDEDQRIYVWFDALINYLTCAGYASDGEAFAKWWPADLHLVGKDILKFHAALWPAMLMSAGLPLPERVFAHGFFTVNGEKMSKSLGNAIDPVELANEYGNDVLRYQLVREIHLGEDGDFSLYRLQARYEGELANELGNLVHRVLTMTEKYLDGAVPERVDGHVAAAWQAYHGAMEEMRLHDALEVAWNLIREANQFIEQQQPWKLAKNDERELLEQTMYSLLETLRHIGWMLLPFMPDTAEKVFAKLGLEPSKEFSQSFEKAWVWGGLAPGGKIAKGEPLFPRRKASADA